MAQHQAYSTTSIDLSPECTTYIQLNPAQFCETAPERFSPPQSAKTDRASDEPDRRVAIPWRSEDTAHAVVQAGEQEVRRGGRRQVILEQETKVESDEEDAGEKCDYCGAVEEEMMHCGRWDETLAGGVGLGLKGVCDWGCY
jgi:hypothetical protein